MCAKEEGLLLSRPATEEERKKEKRPAFTLKHLIISCAISDLTELSGGGRLFLSLTQRASIASLLSLALPLWRMALNTLSLSLFLSQPVYLAGCRSSHRLASGASCVSLNEYSASTSHSVTLTLRKAVCCDRRERRKKGRGKTVTQKATLVLYQSSCDGAFKRKETKRSERNLSSSQVHIHWVI